MEAQGDVRKRVKRSRTNNLNFFPSLPVTVSRKEDETPVYSIPTGKRSTDRARTSREDTAGELEAARSDDSPDNSAGVDL